MKISITADVHMTSRAGAPGRYEALESIFNQAVENGIERIIIAGDLFDASQPNYSEFESLCQKPKFTGLELYVIPGNHDPDLAPDDFVIDRLTIIREPQLLELDDSGLSFLFIPYEEDKSMGQQIAPFATQLLANRWVLVGHGDWSESLRTVNAYEPGIYMPLTQLDVEKYKPAVVFLGHIHIHLRGEKVYYPGSPYPMDISETGYRRFLAFDTETLSVDSLRVETDVIYFDEQFVILPVEGEDAYLKRKIAERIDEWGIEEKDMDRVRVRIKASGYSSDRKAVGKLLEKGFSRFKYYKDEPPDLSDLGASRDVDRGRIAAKVQARIEELEWPILPNEPSRDDILLAALKRIYGA